MTDKQEVKVHDHEAGEIDELVVGPEDTPPKDANWQDWDGAQNDPAVIEEGERLGAGTPDIDFIEDDDGVEEL